MNKSEVLLTIKSWGVNKAFKPIEDIDAEGAWLLKVGKPAQVFGGILSGHEVFVDFQAKAFRVWTHRKQLAKSIAAEHGLKVRLMDGEAELVVPPVLADFILPRFGARVKANRKPPISTPEQREKGLAAANAKKAELAIARQNGVIS